MQLSNRIHLVGSGGVGFDMTDPLDCHVYLIDGDDGWALIDAGAGNAPERIIANIRDSGVDLDRPGHLLLTHGHADHSGGIAGLVDEWPEMRVLAHPVAARWVTSADIAGISLDKGISAGAYPDDYVFRAPPAVASITGGETIDLGGVQIRAIDAPGHCAGHLCLLMNDGAQRALFSGDCLFFDGRISVQNLHDVSIQDYARTLERLGKEQFDIFLPGHGSISLGRGRRHVEAARNLFASGLVPTSIV